VQENERKNTIKGWFPKEVSTSTPQQPTTSPSENVDAPYEGVGCSSPPHEK
jgi:hypothetical protein